MPRYLNQKVIANASNYYSFLRQERGGMPVINHYATPIIRNPGVRERAEINTSTHI